MTITERLQSVRRVFLDTPPLVYYVEEDARYLSRVDPIFEQLDTGKLTAVVSPVTLAECLVMPIRKNQNELMQAFTDLILGSDNVVNVDIGDAIASSAAQLRARYNLSLTDAFQAAVALSSGCDAFLTNDMIFKRVTELNVIVLDEIDSEPEEKIHRL